MKTLVPFKIEILVPIMAVMAVPFKIEIPVPIIVVMTVPFEVEIPVTMGAQITIPRSPPEIFFDHGLNHKISVIAPKLKNPN